MRDDLTIVYYSSGREKPEFEAKIRQSLVESSGGLPIISVTQQPLDFGHNICVGEHEPSSQNAFRQLQIGAMAAKTRFVCPAEADFLYPSEFYSFTPSHTNVAYLATPLYMLIAQHAKSKVFLRKRNGSEGAMIVGRGCLIRGIEAQLRDVGMWGPHQSNGTTIPYLLLLMRYRFFTLTTPVVTFKTDENMHRKSPYVRDSSVRDLPYWGSSQEMLKRYCG